jgi:hypothetical protein
MAGDITWTLRAMEAPEHIHESWVGTSWIVEMTATGTRDAPVSGHAPVSHLSGHHPRGPAATGARPLEH